jgi:glycosyltransferase involved in cell wall biosynthesis
LHNERNLGHGGALNHALAVAQGDLLMVLDHDDLSPPHRLELQSKWLNAHPQASIAGCHLEMIDPEGASLGFYRPPAAALRLRWETLFRCAIPNGASCYRREVVLRAGGLSPAFPICADYELIVRLAQSTELAIVQEVLMHYRVHPAQTSRVKADRTHWEAMVAASTWWRNWLGFNANLGDVGLLYRAVNGWGVAGPEEAARAIALLNELHTRFLAREEPNAADRDYLTANIARKIAAIQFTQPTTQELHP